MGGMEISNESRYISSNGMTTFIEQVLFSNQELSFFDVMSSLITDNVTELYNEHMPEKRNYIYQSLNMQLSINDFIFSTNHSLTYQHVKEAFKVTKFLG